MAQTITKTLLLLALGVPGLAFADNYVINFFEPSSGPYNGVMPTSGGFTYDPVAGFSNFLVGWNGFTYDLTSAANSPQLLSSGCPGAAATPQYGFAMLTEDPSACPSNNALLSPDIATGFIWSADTYYIPDFSFTIFTSTGDDNITALQAHGNWIDGYTFPRGWWTVTDVSESAAPEPGTFALAGLALAVVAGASARRRS